MSKEEKPIPWDLYNWGPARLGRLPRERLEELLREREIECAPGENELVSVLLRWKRELKEKQKNETTDKTEVVPEKEQHACVQKPSMTEGTLRVNAKGEVFDAPNEEVRAHFQRLVDLFGVSPWVTPGREEQQEWWALRTKEGETVNAEDGITTGTVHLIKYTVVPKDVHARKLKAGNVQRVPANDEKEAVHTLATVHEADPEGNAKPLPKRWCEVYERVTVDRPGYCYVLANPSFRENVHKVGLTERTLSERTKELFTTGVPTPFSVETSWHVRNCRVFEFLMHTLFREHRVNKKREFFEVPLQSLVCVGNALERVLFNDKEK